MAAFVVAVPAVAIMLHYLCCSECGDFLYRAAFVLAVAADAIMLHYSRAVNVMIGEVWQRLLLL